MEIDQFLILRFYITLDECGALVAPCYAVAIFDKSAGRSGPGRLKRFANEVDAVGVRAGGKVWENVGVGAFFRVVAG